MSMKLSLKKELIEGQRFFGKDQIYSSPSLEHVPNLLLKIQEINSLAIVKDQYYFQIKNENNQVQYWGPLVQVIGHPGHFSSDFLMIEYRQGHHYHSTLDKIDHISEFLEALKNKLGHFEAYISLEIDKIELHIFKK